MSDTARWRVRFPRAVSVIATCEVGSAGMSYLLARLHLAIISFVVFSNVDEQIGLEL